MILSIVFKILVAAAIAGIACALTLIVSKLSMFRTMVMAKQQVEISIIKELVILVILVFLVSLYFLYF